MHSSTTRLAAALALLLSSTASAYTLQNVTVGSADPSIQYFPPCPSKTYYACLGAWHQSFDSRFYNGSAMIATDASNAFGNVAPYLAYTFRGSAMYMYQWMNSSQAGLMRYYDNQGTAYIDLKKKYPQDAQSSDLTLVLAWSLEDLDPLKEHTIGIQHGGTTVDGTASQLVFDYMVVTMTTLEAGDLSSKKKLSGGAIAGAVIGGIAGLVGLILGFIVYRKWQRQRSSAKSSKGRLAWEGTLAKPTTLQFADPSSELEASEKIAKEGQLEEDERKTGSSAV